MHFLDVGPREYGDAVLCRLGERWVLIDGAHPGDQLASPGHPSIPGQLRDLMGTAAGAPVHVDLLVVTHAHLDHIGCLPFLVDHGLLTAEWALVADPLLGWGRPSGATPQPPSDDAAEVAVRGLREELLRPDAEPAEVDALLADAQSLEQSYTAMLDGLGEAGTHVVRHGRDHAAELLAAFADVGLEILGPSQAQLLVCAEAIAGTTDALAGRLRAAADADASQTAAALYRALAPAARAPQDTADAVARARPAINLQSIVTAFTVDGERLLFAGDMQFAAPQLGDQTLRDELSALRERIRERAPYAVVKLSHHGSDNAFDASVLEDFGTTPLFGICAGQMSASHPNRRVLQLLDDHRDDLRWVRTDRNGLSTIALEPAEDITVDHGEVSDPRPNTSDTPAPAPAGTPALVATSSATPPRPAVPALAAPAAGAPVEVVTRIPPGVSRVTVTIDVTPSGQALTTGVTADAPTVTLAGGRALPDLLFVTNSDGLSTHIGAMEAAAALDAIRRAGARLVDLPAGTTEPATVGELVRAELAGRPGARGVVAIGGYGVVASMRLDTVPADLRAELGAADDADEFIVYSDDYLGDDDGDGIAELPVSRIPDGNSPELTHAALAAAAPAGAARRSGVRNVKRPFAETVFRSLPGAAPMSVSGPATFETVGDLGADVSYLMLHGAWQDGSRFWGEDTADGKEALNLANVPALPGGVVLAGCCWGALTVDHPAVAAVAGVAPAHRAPEASMALTFLRRGANAFVGCTGSHYSPTREPYNYFGKPMQDAFWAGVLGGASPAQALFAAKQRYVEGFPHGETDPVSRAIEYKILGQFTCLGLGW